MSEYNPYNLIPQEHPPKHVVDELGRRLHYFIDDLHCNRIDMPRALFQLARDEGVISNYMFINAMGIPISTLGRMARDWSMLTPQVKADLESKGAMYAIYILLGKPTSELHPSDLAPQEHPPKQMDEFGKRLHYFLQELSDANIDIPVILLQLARDVGVITNYMFINALGIPINMVGCMARDWSMMTPQVKSDLESKAGMYHTYVLLGKPHYNTYIEYITHVVAASAAASAA